MLGDNAYRDGRMEEYQDALFDVFPDLLAHVFLWPAIGNHDKRSFSGPQQGPYFELFDLPTRGESGGVPSSTEQYYSFDYGNVHVVVLDSETAPLEPGSPQLEWLKRDLERNDADWTLATLHIPPYSHGGHNSDTASRHFPIRQNVVPLLEAHGVDLVLAGHSHDYERSYPLHGHYGTSDTWDPSIHRVEGGNGCPDDGLATQCGRIADGAYTHGGTVYVVVGCSSSFTARGKLDYPAMVRTVRSLGSLVIDVDGDRLEARFLEADGVIGDRFVIEHPVSPTQRASASQPEAAPAR
jgi:hypothetical protein